MSVLGDFYADLQSDFALLWRNDLDVPVVAGDVGKPVYLTDVGTVVIAAPEPGDLPVGYVVSVSSAGVKATPRQIELSFGRRDRFKQINYGTGGRVVLQPGDDSGAAGKFEAPRKTEANPRPVFDWIERFDLFVWAQDATHADSFLYQYNMARSLTDLALASVYRISHGRLTIGDPAHVVNSDERFHGVEFRIPCSIRAPVLDRTMLEASDSEFSWGTEQPGPNNGLYLNEERVK
jgi:hypothetical protein